VLAKERPNLGVRIFQIPESKGFLFLARFYAGRDLSHGEPFKAEGALLHNASGPGWIFRVLLLDEGPWVSPVEAPGAKGTSCHAIPTPDATMVVHHHDTVGPLKGGLHRANPHTRRIIAMVAEGHERLVLCHLMNVFLYVLIGLSWKGFFE